MWRFRVDDISETRFTPPSKVMAGPTLLPVRLQPSNVRPIAYRIISKKHGLNIQSDALVVLTETISLRFGAAWRDAKAQQFLEDVAKAWKQQDRGLFVDGPGLAQVIKELTKDSLSKLGMSDSATRLDTLVDEESEKLSTSKEDLDWKDFFQFVSPDKQPAFVFDKLRKQFSSRESAGRKFRNSLIPNLEFFNQRYYPIMERLSRDENFRKSSLSSIAALSSNLNGLLSNYEITLIKNVLGRDGGRFVLCGLLSENANGNFVLEDISDFIELNLTKAHKAEGSFYAPGMFIIVEGIYSASGGSMSNDANVISGCFYASNIGQPPAERRDHSLDAYGHLDFMGMHKDSNSKASAFVKIDKSLQKKLSALEKTLVGHKMIILGGDVFLDDAKIQSGLDKFFARLETRLEEEQDANETVAHSIIVMSGSFSSQPLCSNQRSISQTSSSEEYKSNFDAFAAMLSKYPLVVKFCKLLLIPGVNDPSQSTFSLGRSSACLLPQTPIPNVFVTRLQRLLPKGHLILGWNPMRINYVSQEIVLFRDDLMNKFKRNDLVLDHDIELGDLQIQMHLNGENKKVENIISTEIHLSPKIKQARKLVKTLLDQGNLQPFLKNLRVIVSNYQHVMRIEPLPTTLILFDTRFESFEVTYNGCKVSNIGNIMSNKNSRKFNYAEYSPSAKKYTYKELYF